MHTVVFGRVQRVQKVAETLNEVKGTCLVSRKVGRHTEWERKRGRRRVGLGLCTMLHLQGPREFKRWRKYTTSSNKLD